MSEALAAQITELLRIARQVGKAYLDQIERITAASASSIPDPPSHSDTTCPAIHPDFDVQCQHVFRSSADELHEHVAHIWWSDQPALSSEAAQLLVDVGTLRDLAPADSIPGDRLCQIADRLEAFILQFPQEPEEAGR